MTSMRSVLISSTKDEIADIGGRGEPELVSRLIREGRLEFEMARLCAINDLRDAQNNYDAVMELDRCRPRIPVGIEPRPVITFPSKGVLGHLWDAIGSLIYAIDAAMRLIEPKRRAG